MSETIRKMRRYADIGALKSRDASFVAVSVRFPRPLAETISALAQENDLTFGAQVRELVHQALAKEAK